MVQIGNVPGIIRIKDCLEILKVEGYVQEWELPYEELLTRLSAAVFFLSPISEEQMDVIWARLGCFGKIEYRHNTEKKLSQLPYRFEFKSSENDG